MEPIVNSFNEWDPLEEIIVGILEGACASPLEITQIATTQREILEHAGEAGIRHFVKEVAMPRRATTTPEAYAAAQADLDEFVHILEAEGVRVRRPDPVDHTRPFSTPDWTSLCGSQQSVPRDILIVIGNEILEAPMSVRSRFFEYRAYRRLLREYFAGGARWSAAPKPLMEDGLYDYEFRRGEGWVTTELEPVFDAADIARFGRDLFVQRSHVTNEAGIEWLRRHLAPTFAVHRMEFVDERAIHIDATFVPLAPGKLMVNPDRPARELPAMFRKSGWDILEAPRSTLPEVAGRSTPFNWLHMNVLSLDEKRVLVERNEEPLIRAMKSWGLQPIPCSFRSFYPFGGSFHCATCDIRRRGTLQSYFG